MSFNHHRVAIYAQPWTNKLRQIKTITAMRFVVISETYPPEINGVALTIRTIVTSLAALGHDVLLIRPNQRNHVSEDLSSLEGSVPGTVHEVTTLGIPLPWYQGLRFGVSRPGRIRKLLREHRAEAVYVATEGPLGWAGVRAASSLDLPVLCGFHTHFEQYAGSYGLGFATRFIESYLRRLHNRSDGTVVPTEALAEALTKAGYTDVRVLHRAVDTHRFDPNKRDLKLRETWGAGPDCPVLMTVGRVAPEKNLDLAMRCWEQVRKECPGARFVMVGDGPARAALSKRYPDVIFAGMQLDEDLARHYASADLFLFPSLTETFGNVALEAMASGLAAVCFDYGAAALHMVSGRNGVLVRRGEDQDFVAQVSALAQDLERARAMGREARATTEPLNPRDVARRLVDMVRQVSPA